jgi:long-subunit acyl-CoA synthetase (AMP-forming)
VVEHCLHTAGVTGSNPVPPTSKIKHLQHLRVLFLFGVGKIWEKLTAQI